MRNTQAYILTHFLQLKKKPLVHGKKQIKISVYGDNGSSLLPKTSKRWRNACVANTGTILRYLYCLDVPISKVLWWCHRFKIQTIHTYTVARATGGPHLPKDTQMLSNYVTFILLTNTTPSSYLSYLLLSLSQNTHKHFHPPPHQLSLILLYYMWPAMRKPTTVYRIFQKRKVTHISAFSSPRAKFCGAALGK